MEGLRWYYASRAVLALAAAVVVWVATQSIWMTIAVGGMTFAAFVWYANSDQFVVDTDRPLTPFQRDEREQLMSYKAATYALVVVMLLVAAAGILGLIDGSWASLLVLVGFAVYFVSRAWLRRAM